MIIGISGRKRSGKDSIGAALVAQLGFTRVAFADGLKDLTARIFAWPAEVTRSERFKAEEAAVSGCAAISRTVAGEFSVNPVTSTSAMHLTGRDLLQRIGNGVREVIGNDVWVKLALAKCKRACLNCGCSLDFNHVYKGGQLRQGPAYCTLRKEDAATDAPPMQFKEPHYVITDVRYPNELAAIHEAGGLVIRTNRGDREEAHNFSAGDPPFHHGPWPKGTRDIMGRDYDASKCYWLLPSVRIRACNLPREAHPTHDSGDWHTSETSLPDESNASVKYDFVTTGEMDENVVAALAYVKRSGVGGSP